MKRWTFRTWLSKFLPFSFKEVRKEEPLPPQVLPAIKVTKITYRVLKVKKLKEKHHTRRMCPITDKVCRSEHGAKHKAIQKNLRAYRCPFCDSWHMTHKKNKMLMH